MEKEKTLGNHLGKMGIIASSVIIIFFIMTRVANAIFWTDPDRPRWQSMLPVWIGIAGLVGGGLAILTSSVKFYLDRQQEKQSLYNKKIRNFAEGSTSKEGNTQPGTVIDIPEGLVGHSSDGETKYELKTEQAGRIETNHKIQSTFKPKSEPWEQRRAPIDESGIIPLAGGNNVGDNNASDNNAGNDNAAGTNAGGDNAPGTNVPGGNIPGINSPAGNISSNITPGTIKAAITVPNQVHLPEDLQLSCPYCGNKKKQGINICPFCGKSDAEIKKKE